MARKNKLPTLEELPLASCADLGITSIDCEASHKRWAEVDAAARRSERERKRFVELEILDPAHFPDLDAMRAFVEGPGREAIEQAIRDSLYPSEAAELVPGLTADARRAACWLLGDVSGLVGAVLAGRPGRVRRTRAHDYSEEDLQHARRDLLAFQATENGGLITDAEVQAELLRYLGDGAKQEAA